MVVRKNIDTGFGNEENLALGLVFLAVQGTRVSKETRDSRDGFCGERCWGKIFFLLLLAKRHKNVFDYTAALFKILWSCFGFLIQDILAQ